MAGATLIARLPDRVHFSGAASYFRTRGWAAAAACYATGATCSIRRAVAMLFAFYIRHGEVVDRPRRGRAAGDECNESGVMLPVAGISAIVMPWLIGVIADRVGACDPECSAI